jgi:hypothetical protein
VLSVLCVFFLAAARAAALRAFASCVAEDLKCGRAALPPQSICVEKSVHCTAVQACTAASIRILLSIRVASHIMSSKYCSWSHSQYEY